MSYQVIARKWRPQKFDEVVGQQAVTRTLHNALASGRLAQSFVFAGPRGVGKTTTARILAKALNCIEGPTADPCGKCDACVEIKDGRDIDVLEIDAATHTGIDNIREVIISGLGIMPVRNRYKVFIIDEVHQLSGASFNSLLKSIEEPPPHVVFMMATTELEKIPETVLSRSQVYEFRTINTKAIATQLRLIMDKEGIAVGDDSLQLIARDAEGSMRDAQSKLDQVIAFTGGAITAEDVATVLGLVGRDLLLDTLQAVADEDAPASFALAARAVEMGYDLRAVCRELSRVVRDLLVLSVDPSRISDPEIAGEGERERLQALVARFSREDLLRAFDLLTSAESDIRAAAQPRYHLEMALLRWMHLRKLVPIEDLIAGIPSSSRDEQGVPRTHSARPAPVEGRAASTPAARVAPSAPSARVATSAPAPASGVPVMRSATAAPPASPARPDPTPSGIASGVGRIEPIPARAGSVKDAFLARVKAERVSAYMSVLAQAKRIEEHADRLVLVFVASQKIEPAFDNYRAFFEETATRVAGRKMSIIAEISAVDVDGSPGIRIAQEPEKKAVLKQKALADVGVQTMLEVFPAEIRDVEEM
jgi:DNA polymerase-3 subunit gamma/tau